MKKLILGAILLMLMSVPLFARDGLYYTFSDTTTSSYTSAIYMPSIFGTDTNDGIDVSEFEDILIIIANTDTTYAMNYKVYGYAYYGGTLYEEYLGETVLATDSQDVIKLSDTAYAEIDIVVQWVTGTTTYMIDVCIKK